MHGLTTFTHARVLPSRMPIFDLMHACKDVQESSQPSVVEPDSVSRLQIHSLIAAFMHAWCLIQPDHTPCKLWMLCWTGGHWKPMRKHLPDVAWCFASIIRKTTPNVWGQVPKLLPKPRPRSQHQKANLLLQCPWGPWVCPSKLGLRSHGPLANLKEQLRPY